MTIASSYATVLFADIQVFQLPTKVYYYPKGIHKLDASRPKPSTGPFRAPFFSPFSTARAGGSTAKIFLELAQVSLLAGYSQSRTFT